MKLSLKLFLGVFVITFLVSGSTGSYFYSKARETVYEALRQQLQNAAISGASLVNGTAMDKISAESDDKSDAYRSIQKILAGITAENPDFLYAYTMRLHNGDVLFVVDCPPSDDNDDGVISEDEMSAAVGEEYSNPPDELLHGFVRPSADKEAVQDEWGCTISGYAPVYDDKGNTVGLLGIDMATDRVEEKLANIKKAGLISLAIALILALFLTWFFTRRTIRPIKAVQDGFKKVAAGDLSVQLKAHTNDEIGELTEHFNLLVRELREKEFLKSSMGKIINREVLDRLVNNEFSREGEIVEVTILFCDLRGFTSLSETMPPTLLVSLLNEYFTAMVAVVEENKGMVDKFVGDKIMAVFGHPTPVDNPEQAAFDAALAMLEKCEELNDKLKLQGKFFLRNSLGIHSGPVIAGAIGSKERVEYTVIGDCVNVAAKLEKMTRKYNTGLACSGQFAARISHSSDLLASVGMQEIGTRKERLEVMILKNGQIPDGRS